jgi:DNA-binding protein
MLMEEINEQSNQMQDIINIGNEPVMLAATEVLAKLMNKNQMILKARGQSIPNAVAVANIITGTMATGVFKIEKIKLDTVAEAGIGNMTSTVEIIINKN